MVSDNSVEKVTQLIGLKEVIYKGVDIKKRLAIYLLSALKI